VREDEEITRPRMPENILRFSPGNQTVSIRVGDSEESRARETPLLGECGVNAAEPTNTANGVDLVPGDGPAAGTCGWRVSGSWTAS
jgi:hypothetical protein